MREVSVSNPRTPQFLHEEGNGYWEMYRRFQGDIFGLGGLRGVGYVGGSFIGGICHGGREIQLRGCRIF